jgi:hypothetical protein
MNSICCEGAPYLRSREHFLLLQGGAAWNCGPWQGRPRNPRRPAAPCLRRPAVQQKWIRIVLRGLDCLVLASASELDLAADRPRDFTHAEPGAYSAPADTHRMLYSRPAYIAIPLTVQTRLRMTNSQLRRAQMARRGRRPKGEYPEKKRVFASRIREDTWEMLQRAAAKTSPS